jgi:hypothetical protein
MGRGILTTISVGVVRPHARTEPLMLTALVHPGTTEVRYMDSVTARRTVREMLDSPKLIDRAARLAFEEDGLDGQDGEPMVWESMTEDFKDVFRGTVRQSLRAAADSLVRWTPPEWAPKRAALPWEDDAAVPLRRVA